MSDQSKAIMLKAVMLFKIVLLILCGSATHTSRSVVGGGANMNGQHR